MLATILEWLAQFLLSRLGAWAVSEIGKLEQRGVDDANAKKYENAKSRKDRAKAALDGLNGVSNP